MSERDVERLREGYEALDRGDISLVREFVHPEARMSYRPEIPDATVRRLGRNRAFPARKP